jgi:hypothetical protein
MIENYKLAIEWWNSIYGIPKGNHIDMYKKYYPKLLTEGNERSLTYNEIFMIYKSEFKLD